MLRSVVGIFSLHIELLYDSNHAMVVGWKVCNNRQFIHTVLLNLAYLNFQEHCSIAVGLVRETEGITCISSLPSVVLCHSWTNSSVNGIWGFVMVDGQDLSFKAMLPRVYGLSRLQCVCPNQSLKTSGKLNLLLGLPFRFWHISIQSLSWNKVQRMLVSMTHWLIAAVLLLNYKQTHQQDFCLSCRVIQG